MRAVSLALVLSMFAGPSFGAGPSVSTHWEDMSLTQEQCYAVADSVLRRTGHVRVERIGTSTFGDTPDKETQVVIRCAATKQIVFFVVAGGNGSDKVTHPLAIKLKDEFLASMQKAAN